jgi:hypothetical protein
LRGYVQSRTPEAEAVLRECDGPVGARREPDGQVKVDGPREQAPAPAPRPPERAGTVRPAFRRQGNPRPGNHQGPCHGGSLIVCRQLILCARRLAGQPGNRHEWLAAGVAAQYWIG